LTAAHGRAGGGRTWWAHFAFTRTNIEPIILRKKIEDLHQLGAVMCPEWTSVSDPYLSGQVDAIELWR
jgi:hypothetical protein